MKLNLLVIIFLSLALSGGAPGSLQLLSGKKDLVASGCGSSKVFQALPQSRLSTGLKAKKPFSEVKQSSFAGKAKSPFDIQRLLLQHLIPDYGPASLISENHPIFKVNCAYLC